MAKRGRQEPPPVELSPESDELLNQLADRMADWMGERLALQDLGLAGDEVLPRKFRPIKATLKKTKKATGSKT